MEPAGKTAWAASARRGRKPGAEIVGAKTRLRQRRGARRDGLLQGRQKRFEPAGRPFDSTQQCAFDAQMQGRGRTAFDMAFPVPPEIGEAAGIESQRAEECFVARFLLRLPLRPARQPRRRAARRCRIVSLRATCQRVWGTDPPARARGSEHVCKERSEGVAQARPAALPYQKLYS